MASSSPNNHMRRGRTWKSKDKIVNNVRSNRNCRNRKTHLELVRDGIFLVGRTKSRPVYLGKGVVGREPWVLVECQTFNLITNSTTKNVIPGFSRRPKGTKPMYGTGVVPSTGHSRVESECIWAACCRWRDRSGSSGRRHRWSCYCRSPRSVKKKPQKGTDQTRKNKGGDDIDCRKREKGNTSRLQQLAQRQKMMNRAKTGQWRLDVCIIILWSRSLGEPERWGGSGGATRTTF